MPIKNSFVQCPVTCPLAPPVSIMYSRYASVYTNVLSTRANAPELVAKFVIAWKVLFCFGKEADYFVIDAETS